MSSTEEAKAAALSTGRANGLKPYEIYWSKASLVVGAAVVSFQASLLLMNTYYHAHSKNYGLGSFGTDAGLYRASYVGAALQTLAILFFVAAFAIRFYYVTGFRNIDWRDLTRVSVHNSLVHTFSFVGWVLIHFVPKAIFTLSSNVQLTVGGVTQTGGTAILTDVNKENVLYQHDAFSFTWQHWVLLATIIFLIIDSKLISEPVRLAWWKTQYAVPKHTYWTGSDVTVRDINFMKGKMDEYICSLSDLGSSGKSKV